MSDDRTRGAIPQGSPTATGDYVPDATPEGGSTRLVGPKPPERTTALPDIPGYAVTHELARGGMGRVLAATDLGFGREVAVKVMLPGTATEEAAGRFVREARITGRLAHPGVPPAYHLGELPDGSPFLAMKLVRGRTLAELLKDRPTTAHDLPRFVGILEQVCQAVGFAHARGVIHRDLKPANVMVGAFGEVQVMDWGLAAEHGVGGGGREDEPEPAFLPPPSSPLLTVPGVVMGTPAYMAPEQARGEALDARADVFALGGMLCEVLTGAAAFRGESGIEVVKKAAGGDLADAHARLAASGADAELIAVVARCLSADPAARPADGAAAAALLAAYRLGVEERLRAAERDRAAAEARAAEEANTRREAEARAAERRRRRRAQYGAGALAVALLGVAGAGAVVASFWRTAEQAKGAAETARDQLTDEKKATETARDDAVAARRGAEAARDAARKAEAGEAAARRLEESARLREEAARKKLAVFEYGRTMEVARAEFRANNFVAARGLLDGTDPALRGWEWDHFSRVCGGSFAAFRGHTKPVRWVAFSADGSRLVTAGGSDLTAKIWDATTGRDLLTLRGHTNSVNSAEFSPDGSRVVTAGGDRTVRLWDARTGAPRWVFHTNFSDTVSASFSPDGTRVVTAGFGGDTVRVWNAQTGAPLFPIAADSQHATAAVYSPDGTRIATGGGDDGVVKLWDARTGAAILTCQSKRNLHARRLAFSPDGRRLAAGGNPLRVWDTRTGEKVLEPVGDAFAVAFSPDGARIATTAKDVVRVLDAGTGGAQLILRSDAGTLAHTAFSPDGTRLVASGSDNTVRCWDATAGSELDNYSILEKDHHSRAARFSPDGTRILSVEFQLQRGDRPAEQVVRIRDAGTGAVEVTLRGHPTGVTDVEYTPDGSRVVTAGGGDKTAKVWDARTGAELLTYRGHTATESIGYAAQSVAVSPDGERVATSGVIGTRVWDIRTGADLAVFKGHFAGGHQQFVYAARFTSDGRRVVSVGGDRAVRVWDAGSGAEVFARHDLQSPVAAAFSRDGARMIVVGAGAWVLDAKSGADVVRLNALAGAANFRSGTFSPDGSRVVTGGSDGTARIWDAHTGAELFSLRGHAGDVTAEFSPDGSRVMTRDIMAVRVWDAQTRHQLAPPARPPAPAPRAVGW